MVKTHAGRALAAEDCISILSNAMTDEMWQFIRKEGKLFDYKYHLGRDVDAMERAEPFMLAVLEIEPTGIFIKTPMIKALEKLAKGSPKVVEKSTARTQATDFYQLFMDLRAIRKNSTSRARLPGHVIRLSNKLTHEDVEKLP